MLGKVRSEAGQTTMAGLPGLPRSQINLGRLKYLYYKFPKVENQTCILM